MYDIFTLSVQNFAAKVLFFFDIRKKKCDFLWEIAFI